MLAASPTSRTLSTAVTARWLYSIAVATVNSGTNCPLHSGHERPQPSAEPVLVTAAPITSTSSIPPQVAAASQRSPVLVDNKDGFALELPLAHRMERTQGIVPAGFQADPRLECSARDLACKQREVGPEGGRLARLVYVKRVQRGVSAASEDGEADRAFLSRRVAKQDDNAVPADQLERRGQRFATDGLQNHVIRAL